MSVGVNCIIKLEFNMNIKSWNGITVCKKLFKHFCTELNMIACLKMHWVLVDTASCTNIIMYVYHLLIAMFRSLLRTNPASLWDSLSTITGNPLKSVSSRSCSSGKMKIFSSINYKVQIINRNTPSYKYNHRASNYLKRKP